VKEGEENSGDCYEENVINSHEMAKCDKLLEGNKLQSKEMKNNAMAVFIEL